MHCLQTVAFLIWSFLLLQSAADEEAPWGPTKSTTPSKEKPPGSKQGSYWWLPSIKIPSLSWLNRGSDGNALTTTYQGLTQSSDQSEEVSGSGDESISKTSEPPTASTHGSLSSATHPTRTSSSAHSSTAVSDNDSLVSASYSLLESISSTDTPLTSSANTNKDESSPTRTYTTWGTVETGTNSQDATQAPATYINRETDTSNTYSPAAHKTTTNTEIALILPLTISSSSNGLTSQYLETTIPEKKSVITSLLDKVKTTTTEVLTTQHEATTSFIDQEGVVSTSAMETDGATTMESTTSTTGSLMINFPIFGGQPNEEAQKDAKNGAVGTRAPPDVTAPHQDVSTGLPYITTSKKPHTTSPLMSTDTPPVPEHTDWIFSPVDNDAAHLPDCNKERTGICNMSDTWETTTLVNEGAGPNNSTAVNKSTSLFLLPASPLLVPLYTDWNSAMAAWGLAWEVHVYGVGCVFATLTLASALNLLCLPLRCPSGCGYFALVSLFLLAAGCTRAFSLLYDAYGHLDRIPSTEASLMLYEAPFPCITAAFGLVFLLLSMRSRMQLSYSAFQRPCFLACLVTLHFAAAFGPETLLKFYENKQPFCLFFTLISRGAFVVLATFLSSAYFVFYIYVRADSKHIYHLNNTSPTPAERYNRCPFAESRDWDRAAVTVCLSALFSLACAGLQLYAMLNAMGVAGGETVFYPWSWWTFQFSCRLCELVVCLTLAFVVAQPVYCSDQLPAAGNCWTELLASKSPIMPGSYQWSLSQQEKLAIVDTVGLGETESLPLYTLMDSRFANSMNGLDLLYHSNRALAYRDLELDLNSSLKPEDVGGGEPSVDSSFTSDSTTDLRPPSPINLRRSIDEALFSEALFPMSLFSPAPIRCSDQSMSNKSALACDSFSNSLTTDPGIYRTSSCVELPSKHQTTGNPSQTETMLTSLQSPSMTSTSTCVSSPEHWGRSSSSCSLYRTSLGGSSFLLSPSHAEHQCQSDMLSSHIEPSYHSGSADPQRQYQTLGAASQESLDLSSEADRSVQEEFISVCRQIDALSICSETIDL